jgi:hypothetical protein
MKLSKLKLNDKNPRTITESEFNKLKNSVKSFEKMMSLRPIVVDEKNVILGGNQRYRALQALGYKEIPDEWVKQAKDLSEEEKKEFIIKDNVPLGQWDWDMLANEDWQEDKLNDWMAKPVIPFDSTSAFAPNLEPTFDASKVTQEEIERKAKELAEQMMKRKGGVDVICPECGHLFEIDG